jgi:hypothetical protein
MENVILKKLIKYVLHSLLIPFIIRHLDEWTTIINKKIKNLIEDKTEDV